MMPGNGNGPLSVPPGFRFHPTDEELLYYYLKKKVSYEAIDLDVIREVDLNKLEPWDLKDRCRIGSGPQNEWYFFSHKDKKYPTGTRTNRATAAGFWKATGRDKAIFLGNAKRIGMRKTLVFYTGRAPHGHKTDWIMHEYRLNDDDPELQQEDGWVVCRVFKKKNHGRGLQHELLQDDDFENQTTLNHPSSSNNHLIKGNNNGNSIASSSSTSSLKQHNNNNYNIQPMMFPSNNNNNYYTNNNNEYITSFDGTMHLPQLSNTDSIPQNAGQSLFTTMDNILRLSSNNTSTNNGGLLNGQQLLGGGLTERLANNNGAEWGFLDKLLANYQGLEQHDASHNNKVVVAAAAANHQEIVGIMSSANNGLQHHQHHAKFPFHYLGSDSDLLKFSK